MPALPTVSRTPPPPRYPYKDCPARKRPAHSPPIHKKTPVADNDNSCQPTGDTFRWRGLRRRDASSSKGPFFCEQSTLYDSEDFATVMGLRRELACAFLCTQGAWRGPARLRNHLVVLRLRLRVPVRLRLPGRRQRPAHHHRLHRQPRAQRHAAAKQP